MLADSLNPVGCMDQTCSGMSHGCLIGLGSGEFGWQVDTLGSL